MKKLLLYAGAVIVALASCTKDPVPSEEPREKGETVIYEFGTAVPEGFSRYDMEKGALTQVNPEEVLLRYVMEVYDLSGNIFGRYIRYVDFTEKSGTNFRVQLMADYYNIAVWADFIPKSLFPEAEPSPIGNGYIDPSCDLGELPGYFWGAQTSLAEMDAKADYFDDKGEWFTMGGRRMLRDAYCGTTSIDLLGDTSTSGAIALKRPLGRFAVYGKNMDADRLAAAGIQVPDSVTVTYPAGTVVMQYNVVEGKVRPVYNESDMVFGHNLDINHPVESEGNIGGSQYTDLQLITFDYLLPTYKNENPDDDVLTTLTIKYFSKGAEIADLETVVPEFEVAANKQSRFVANPFGDDHQYVAVVKDAEGNVITPVTGGLMDASTALTEAYAMVPEGGTIKLYAGEFKADNMVVEKGITIEGVEGKTVIYAENPVDQTTSVGSYYGKNPIIFVKGGATPIEVAVKDVQFTIKNSPAPAAVDGLTVDGNVTLSLENVVFDGIANTPFTHNGMQSGRCVTVLGGSILNAEGCTFKNYNKNAVDVFEGGTANLSNCTVVGNNYNAQKVYDETEGTEEEKLAAAYSCSSQNGFVFRTGAAGSVTGCSFSDITFNLDKGLRQEKYDQSRAVYLYEPDETTLVTGEEDETNTYTNCELNWSAWNYTPPLDDATLSAIMLNGEPIENFDPSMTTEPININVPSNVASALITAESTDFYAEVEINPAVATELEVNVPVTFTITTSSEQFVVTGSGQQLTYTVVVTRIPSTDATLKELKYNGEMVPEFNPEEFAYNLEVPFSVDKMTITAENNYPTATQIIDPEGEVELVVGEVKTFNVDVTAEDGTTTNRYTINVTRLPDTDATLSTLQYNDGAEEDKLIDGFDPTVLDYTLTVPTEIASIEIKAAASSSVAQVVVSPAGPTQLVAGVETPFTVEVTAQDGVTKQTYTVKVTRELSNNANLASLGVSGFAFTEEFDKDKLAYTVLLPSSQETISIEATAESTYEGVSVAIDPTNVPLVPGVPVAYNIVVTAQDQITVKTYQITALRASDNAQLGSLMVNGTPVVGFNPEVMTGYVAYVSNASESVTIDAIAADADPRVQISVLPAGDATIAPGTYENYTVTVIAADGVAEASYEVQVYRMAANWLSNLEVNGQTIAGFSPNSLTYTNSNFDGETAEITATAGVSTATVDIAPAGPVELVPGAPQTFTITVTPTVGDDLTPAVYTVNLTRPVE